MIAEPGRYVAASAFTLATQVTSRRIMGKEVMYYVNDGIYGSFNCLLYENQKVTPIPLDPVSLFGNFNTWAMPVEIVKCLHIRGLVYIDAFINKRLIKLLHDFFF